MARLTLTLLAGLLLACQAGAEPRFPGSSDEPSPFELPSSMKDKGPGVTPLAVALSMCFEPADWTKIGVSTSPVIEMARLLRSGHYRLEILQMALMASASGRGLSTLAVRRDKGESLQLIAGSLSADYDGIYERALRMAEDVDRWEKSVRTVEPLARGERAPDAPRPRVEPKRLPGMGVGPGGSR